MKLTFLTEQGRETSLLTLRRGAAQCYRNLAPQEGLPMHAPFSCAHCTAPLQPGAGNFYRITIEAAADPTPPDLSSDDSPAAIRRKIEQLLAQMANLSEQEA